MPLIYQVQRMIKPRHITSNQAGFTLVEVMIAMVVFAIGLLGLAGLQATSLMNEHASYTRSQAVLLAYEMADRMRANPDGGTAYETATTETEADITGYSSTLCTANPCTPANMAIYDLGSWKAALPDLLLSGQGQIVNTADTNYTITVHWDEDRTGATGTTCPVNDETDLRCFQLSITL